MSCLGQAQSGGLEQIQFLESDGQAARLAESGGSEIVGDLFALDPDLFRNPPDGRVIEQQGLDGALHQIDQIVPALEMGELMSQEGLQQVRRYARKQGSRDQD